MSKAVHIILHDEKGNPTDEFIAGPFESAELAEEWIDRNYRDADNSPDYSITVCDFLAPNKARRRGR